MPSKTTRLAETLRQRRSSAKRQRRVDHKLTAGTGTTDLVGIVGIDILVLNIGGREHRFNIREELTIRGSEADKTLEEHSERVAMWGNLAECMKHEIAYAEIDLDDVKKNRYLAYRSELRAAAKLNNQKGVKTEKWTDREITSVIDTDPDVVKARKSLIDKKQTLGYCTSMVRALTQRAKMILKWGKMTAHADDNVES